MKDLGNRIKSSFRTRAFSSGTSICILAVTALVLALLVSLLTGALPDRWTKIDTTKNDIYSVSPATEKLLSQLENEVEVYCIVQSGAEDKTVQELLNRFEGLSNNITISYVDPVLYPTFTLAYTSETLTENSLIVKNGERFTIVDYNDVFTYELNYDTYAYDAYFDGESLLTCAIDYVTRENLPSVYRLTGHGEDEPGTALQSAIARQNIRLSELSLVANEIPEDCQCLFIIGPDSDISTEDAEKIKNYIADGGNILLFTTYTEVEMPNLASVAAEWGAELMNGIVVEDSSGYSLSGYPHYLVPDFGEHEIVEPLIANEYVCLLPIAQGIKVDSERENTEASVLLRSSEKSYIKVPVEYVIDSYDYVEGEERASYPVAVACEKTDEANARLVWIASTYILEPDYDSIVSGANTDFIMNSIDWMTDREDSISISAKSVSVEYLSTQTSNTLPWAVILIGILPLGVLVFGIVVTIKRKRR